MTSKYLYVSAALLAISTAAFAAPMPVSCPANVTVKQQLSTPVAGWKAGKDSMPHRLASITFFDGPPEDNASLVYDKLTKSPGKEVGVWKFAANGSRVQWISCGYLGTSITLSKSLPTGVTSCSVTYNSRRQVSGLPMIERIDCK